MRKILIPTYNEAGNIASIIARVRQVAPEAHILVIDDNSPDGTGGIVEDIAARDTHVKLLARESKEGLGKAYLHGFREALTDSGVTHVVMMDADFSHDPAYLPQLFAKGEDFDLVTGSRYARGGSTEGWEAWRKYLSSGGNIYVRAITGIPITDVTAGFNHISVDVLRHIDFAKLDSSGYAFQIELKYLLWKAGARTTEIPILFRNRREGESKISNHIIKEGLIAPWKLILKHR